MLPAKLYKPVSMLIILSVILSIIFLFRASSINFVYPVEAGYENNEAPAVSSQTQTGPFTHHSALGLLGKSFYEIKEILGEPDHEGSSNMYGPHNYISYDYKAGTVRFNSPQGLNENLAVSIIMNGEHKIFCAGLDMSLSEIEEILGKPDFGPETGVDGLYHTVYYLGEIKNQVPEVFISFSAEDIEGEILEAFIKWEAFDYNYGDRNSAAGFQL